MRLALVASVIGAVCPCISASAAAEVQRQRLLRTESEESPMELAQADDVPDVVNADTLVEFVNSLQEMDNNNKKAPPCDAGKAEMEQKVKEAEKAKDDAEKKAADDKAKAD